VTPPKYREFLDQRLHCEADGFEPVWMPDFLFGFQRHLVEWAIWQGRGAIFADCGLGKTPMQLVWAENVVRRMNRPVLIATPLAVGQQLRREGEKFGVECTLSRDGKIPSGAKIVTTNYERIHLFDPADFCGMVCDESSILKNFDGVRKAEVTEFLRTLPYRLLCTATAAPNDYTELGTSSEALGLMGHLDMLNRFFRNQQNTTDTRGRWKGHSAPRIWEGKQWRFKGHAEGPFWKWVSSWARALRQPSDLGFDNADFDLEPYVEEIHTVRARSIPEGYLFEFPAVSLQEQRAERRRTLAERCEKAASLVNSTGEQALVWCHLNDESTLLEKLIDESKEVTGSHSDEIKEERLAAFANGDLRVLVTKPRIGAWGLNLQGCAHVVFFPSHSYEQFYQAVRRCWRYGQTRRVKVDIVATEGDLAVTKNLQRKAVAADRMFSSIVGYMDQSTKIETGRKFKTKSEVPQWL